MPLSKFKCWDISRTLVRWLVYCLCREASSFMSRSCAGMRGNTLDWFDCLHSRQRSIIRLLISQFQKPPKQTILPLSRFLCFPLDRVFFHHKNKLSAVFLPGSSAAASCLLAPAFSVGPPAPGRAAAPSAATLCTPLRPSGWCLCSNACLCRKGEM